MNSNTLTPLKRTLLLALFCVVTFWTALDKQAINRRIASNPHVTGTVDRTWTVAGKHGGRFADVTFRPSSDDGRLTCQVRELHIGPTSLQIEAGQGLELAPRPGSCESPDVPIDAPYPWLVVVLYALSFVTGTAALMTLTSGPTGRLRSSF